MTDDGEVELLATRCASCGHVSFPPLAACSRCWDRDAMEPYPLQSGRIYSSTVVHIGQEGIDAPFAMAYVDFEDDVRVCGRLAGVVPLAPGTPVVAREGTLRHGGEVDLRGWTFEEAPSA